MILPIKTAILLLASVLQTTTIAWSPTDSYAPGIVDCPSYLNDSDYNTNEVQGLIRAANNLSEPEQDWLLGRDAITHENLKWFLQLANMTDYNATHYLDELVALSITNSSVINTPRIGLAFSGGGYRAMLTAAGEISGLDNRTVGCLEHGLPILDAVTYISGLSGGSWFLSTLAFNNWTSVQEIVDQVGTKDAIWDLQHSMFTPGGINIFKTLGYWDSITNDLELKKDAGFDLSLTDPWGRALSHQFYPGLEDFGASMTFTSIRNFSVFQDYQMPFPILVTDGREPGTYIISENSTVFEINPYEMGSWDPSLYSFVDLEYIGTNMTNGRPSDDVCYAGLDNTGYMFGTSSTLFNQFILQLNSTGISGVLYDLVHSFLTDLSNDDNDIAEYYPNPFYGSEWAEVDTIVNNHSLYLVDGGEDNQNIPLQPLIQSERQIDAVFAYDNSFDTNQTWPNGTSMVYTYERQFSSQANRTSFPYVPDQATFLNLNLTAKPTFFGCYSSNLTSLIEENGTDYIPPLIIYTANRPFSYYSNTSTYKMSYSDDEVLGIIQNGFEVSTRLNLTLDDEFRACIGCAILQRSRERQGFELGDQCQRCFDEYCWDGTLDPEVKDIAVNFTTTGMTNGEENLNNTSSNKTSGAAGMMIGGGVDGLLKVVGALLVVCLVTF